MEWTEAEIDRLRGLWTEGHSTAEIGRRMGITKNAVVGKAHRLSLAARPSPIRYSGARSVARTLPTESGGLPPTPVSIVSPEHRRSAERPVRVLPVASRQAATNSRHRAQPCCWPIGEPGTKSFHFCDGETLLNKPYCLEHAQLAYVKVRDKRDVAA